MIPIFLASLKRQAGRVLTISFVNSGNAFSDRAPGMKTFLLAPYSFVGLANLTDTAPEEPWSATFFPSLWSLAFTRHDAIFYFIRYAAARNWSRCCQKYHALLYGS